MEKGIKAFVSYIRAYKEHHCSYIFRFAFTVFPLWSCTISKVFDDTSLQVERFGDWETGYGIWFAADPINARGEASLPIDWGFLAHPRYWFDTDQVQVSNFLVL